MASFSLHEYSSAMEKNKNRTKFVNSVLANSKLGLARMTRNAREEYQSTPRGRGVGSPTKDDVPLSRYPNAATAASSSSSFHSDSSFHETKEDLADLGIDLEADVIERLQRRLGSNLFASAIKASQTLRQGQEGGQGRGGEGDHYSYGYGSGYGGYSLSSADADAESRSAAAALSAIEYQYVSGDGATATATARGNTSTLTNSEASEAQRRMKVIAKTPMGHLLDTSLTSPYLTSDRYYDDGTSIGSGAGNNSTGIGSRDNNNGRGSGGPENEQSSDIDIHSAGDDVHDIEELELDVDVDVDVNVAENVEAQAQADIDADADVNAEITDMDRSGYSDASQSTLYDELQEVSSGALAQAQARILAKMGSPLPDVVSQQSISTTAADTGAAATTSVSFPRGTSLSPARGFVISSITPKQLQASASQSSGATIKSASPASVSVQSAVRSTRLISPSPVRSRGPGGGGRGKGKGKNINGKTASDTSAAIAPAVHIENLGISPLNKSITGTASSNVRINAIDGIVSNPTPQRLFDMSVDADPVMMVLSEKRNEQYALPKMSEGQRYSGTGAGTASEEHKGGGEQSAITDADVYVENYTFQNDEHSAGDGNDDNDDDPDTNSAPLLSYMMERGIAKMDINDPVGTPHPHLALPRWAGGSLEDEKKYSYAYLHDEDSVSGQSGSLSQSRSSSHHAGFNTSAKSSRAVNYTYQEDDDEHLLSRQTRQKQGGEILVDSSFGLNLNLKYPSVRVGPGRSDIIFAAVDRLSPHKVSRGGVTDTMNFTHTVPLSYSVPVSANGGSSGSPIYSLARTHSSSSIGTRTGKGTRMGRLSPHSPRSHSNSPERENSSKHDMHHRHINDQSRYEHEMSDVVGGGVLQRSNVRERAKFATSDDVGHPCHTIPHASAIDGIDPAYRHDLDALITGLQYSYAASSEKFVRRLYDYPVNAPKVNIKIIMQRRYAHPEFFKQGIHRCILSGHLGSRWATALSGINNGNIVSRGEGGGDSRQNEYVGEIVWCLYQLVRENRRLPGEKERRPCVDLWRFLRMLRTNDFLRSQWRIGGKKAVEEFNIACSLHKKENGGTNVPIPTTGTHRVHLLQRLEDQGSKNMQIGDLITEDRYEYDHLAGATGGRSTNAEANEGGDRSASPTRHFSHGVTRHVSGVPHGRQPNEGIGLHGDVTIYPTDESQSQSGWRRDNKDFPTGDDATSSSKETARNSFFQARKEVNDNNSNSRGSRDMRDLMLVASDTTSSSQSENIRRSSHGASYNAMTNSDAFAGVGRGGAQGTRGFKKAHTMGSEHGVSQHEENQARNLTLGDKSLIEHPGVIPHFHRQQINASTVAEALYASDKVDDQMGREKFRDPRDPNPPKMNKVRGCFTIKEREESNKSGEAAKYRAKIEHMSKLRGAPRGDNVGAPYRSISSFMKYQDCGVASLLKHD